MAVSTERDQTATRADLSAWLTQRLGGRDVEVGEIAIPGLSGFSNETLVFDATWDDGDGPAPHGLVIRVEPGGHQVFPSTEFDAQVRILRALHGEGSVPVPEVLWFEEDRSILGARFVVMARVDGEVPADNPSYHAEGWFHALGEGGRADVWDNGLDAMANVHLLAHGDPSFTWVAPRTPEEQLVLDRAYQSFAVGDRPFPVVERAFELVEDSVPPPAAVPAVCWGDSRIGNMIFGADRRVAAVLDWEMLTAGDPVQDLAWYLLVDRHHHEAFGVPRLSGMPGRAASVARWEARSGRSAEHLAWYELLGAVRFALILARTMQLLDRSGILPGASDAALDQTGSQLLQRLLDERT